MYDLARLPVKVWRRPIFKTFFPSEAKFVIRGGRMRIRIGEPIATEGLKSGDRKKPTRGLEQSVRELLVRKFAG